MTVIEKLKEKLLAISGFDYLWNSDIIYTSLHWTGQSTYEETPVKICDLKYMAYNNNVTDQVQSLILAMNNFCTADDGALKRLEKDYTGTVEEDTFIDDYASMIIFWLTISVATSNFVKRINERDIAAGKEANTNAEVAGGRQCNVCIDAWLGKDWADAYAYIEMPRLSDYSDMTANKALNSFRWYIKTTGVNGMTQNYTNTITFAEFPKFVMTYFKTMKNM